MRTLPMMTISGNTLAAVALFFLGQGAVVSAAGEGGNFSPAWVFETSTAVEVTQNTPASPRFRFIHLTVEDGLSDSAMSSAVQDQQGFMWFGTERGGLNRYDGYEFKVYQHEEGNERSLSQNKVTALLLDHQGTLWVGTGGGLNRYNRDTDDFTCYRPIPGDDTSLADISVNALCEDSSGAIWVGTDKGVCRLDRKTGKFVTYRHDPKNPRSLSSDFIRSVFADPQSGWLWVGTVDEGACVLDPESGEFTPYRFDPDIPGSIGGSDVTCFLRDQAGVLWVGTGGGLNRFVPETKTFVHYRHNPKDPNSVSDDYVWALYEDRAGRFWVCTPRGLNLMDRSRGVFSQLLASRGDPTSYCAASLNHVCEDNTGAIWATSHLHGVVRLPSVPEKFLAYCHNPENTNSLSHSMVQGIHIDRNNRAWIGTLDGLDYLDDCRPPVKHSIPIDAHAVTEDRQGQIWAGAFPQGLFRIHGDSVTHYPHDPHNPNSPATDQIWALEADDLGGLWIIYWAAGIGHFDGKTFTHYTADPADPQCVPASQSYGFAKDRDGFIWLVGEGGLTRFRPEDAVFNTYLIDPEHPEADVNRSMLSVYIDGDRFGEMWVGTLFGLFRFDPVSGRVTRHYTKKDGLSSDNVQSIQRDHQGRLWVGTTAGLSRLDPAQGTFRNYDKSDGLPGNKFFIGAAAKASDGQMFFGSTEGLATFYPDKMPDNPNPPPVVLTDFQLFNKPVVIGEDSPLQKAIHVADRITLRYDQNVFRLRFAALDYTAPARNRYAYKLEGFDKDWRYVGASDRSATYTRLSPGVYTFRVKASNNDGVWNEQGASIRIVVVPPWWHTWWAWNTTAAILLALAIGGYRRRVNNIERRNRKLEQQVAERTTELAAVNEELEAFAYSVSHDLRAPLRAISGFSSILIRSHRDSLSGEGRHYLDNITQASNRMEQLIRDLLAYSRLGRTGVNPQPVNLNIIFGQLATEFAERVEKIGGVLEIEDNLPTVMGDKTLLSQIFTNLLDNAFTYRRPDVPAHVSVTAQTEARSATLCVRDNGIGIPSEHFEKIFNIFQRLHGQDKYPGTGIGLATVKKSVEMLGGQLRLESAEGKGSAFFITLVKE